MTAHGAKQLLSPELVLVDPDLAKLARTSPPERAWERERDNASARPLKAGPVPRGDIIAASSPPSKPGRRMVRYTALAASLTALTGLLVLTSVGPDAARFSDPRTERRAAIVPRPKLPPPTPLQGDARTLAWAPAANAAAYEVALFRGKDQILVRKTSKPRVTVRQAWTYRGRRFSLAAGDYRWYVWPLGRKRGTLVRRDPVVQATFTISG